MTQNLWISQFSVVVEKKIFIITDKYAVRGLKQMIEYLKTKERMVIS
jgi:hypothetical protein